MLIVDSLTHNTATLQYFPLQVSNQLTMLTSVFLDHSDVFWILKAAD